jgi:uncharacterized protein DUF4124
MAECAMRLHVWVCVGFSLCVATLPAAAQWKWKDSRGQVVISDTPPPRDIPERDVLQKPSLVSQRSAAQLTPAASAPAAETVAKAKVDPELEARRKKTEGEQAERVKADETKIAAQRADNCQRAKAYIETLQSGVRLTRRNDKGELEYLDDSQRAAEMQRARQGTSTDCR